MKATDANRDNLGASYARLPLSFERNQGQTDPSVEYLARGAGYTLFITATEAVLVLRQPGKAAPVPGPNAGIPGEGDAAVGPANMVSGKVEATILRMKLLGSNPEPLLEGRDELPGKSNYFIGNDPKKWRTGVSQYMKVRNADVYPGIDLVYYGNQGRLEYDFVVMPGADPGAVQLSFEGADRLRVDDTGNLVIAVPGGEVVQHVPLVYQEINDVRRNVQGRYVLDGEGRVGFQVAAYDTGRPLVIDPVLSYSTYLGGGSYDGGHAIAVDSVGNAYVTGYTLSTDFPTQLAYQGSGGPTYDAFVTKLDPNAGELGLVYSTYLGGNSQSIGFGIAVDSAGDAYVTGHTVATDFPTLNAYQVSNGGGADAFLTKLNLNAGIASLVYSTYLGGNGDEEGLSIAVDSFGNAYVTGYTRSTDFPILNAYQGSHGGYLDPDDPYSYYDYYDVFVTKLNPASAGAASLLYSTYLGGDRADYGWGIAVDSLGDAYVTGYTVSPNFPVLDAYQASHASPLGGEDVFVTKLDPVSVGAASLRYSTYLGGADNEFGMGIAVDSFGNAYVTGYTHSDDFPVLNAYQESRGDVYYGDAFVTKLNPNVGALGLVYSTYLGGNRSDWGSGIAVDSAGNAYVTGVTHSDNFPVLDGYQGSLFAGGDAFVTKLNPNAGGAPSLLYSTYLGGPGYDSGSAIAVDSIGNAYVTGETWSTDFPVLDGYQTSDPGSVDAFVTKLGSTNQVPIAEDQSVTTDEDATVSITLTGTDGDGDTLTYSVLQTPTNGTLSGTAPNLVYTPNANFNGTDSLTFQVNDGSLDSNIAMISITVTPVADVPVADGQSVTTDEDAAVPITLTGTDGDGDTLTYSVLQTPTNGTLSGTAPNLVYTPNDNFNGTDSLTFQVNDGSQNSDIVTVSIIMDPVNDAPVADAGAPYTVSEGSTVVLNGAGSDVEGDVLTYEWDLDGDGIFETTGANPDFGPKNDNGVVTVTLRVTDPSGESDIAMATVNVVNVAPAVTASGDTIDENGAATMSGMVADPSPVDTFTVTIDWGDGNTESFAYPAGSTAYSEAHQYLDDNPTGTASDSYNVTVTVTDDDGGATAVATTVTVNNVAPMVSGISATLDPVPVGTNVTASADFTDPGTADTHIAAWNWGDGPDEPGSVNEFGGSGSTQDDHVYTAPGVYTITVTVTDDDGGQDLSWFMYVAVYDPNGSFVTGSGLIDSPAGAYVDAPALTGLANFGFASRYTNGASVPTGSTMFRFRAGDLHLTSSTYQWLVVGGARAQFKGTGTIKDRPGTYGFLVTAIDGAKEGGGGADRFRIKIWDASDETVVYDNQVGTADDSDPTTVIRAGSIVISDAHNNRRS